MSKKLAKKQADNSRSPWTTLPSDLLLLISSFLSEKIDVFHFRRVCSLWRSSIPRFPNQNIISSLFSGLPPPYRLFPKGIYLLKNQSLAFIMCLHEYEPGKLLLRHPLTHTLTIASSLDSLNSLVSGWTITRLALSHSLVSFRKVVPTPCFIPQFHSSFDEECEFYGHGNLIIYHNKINPINKTEIERLDGLVNFCGCTYAVDQSATVHLVRQFGSKRLTCVNLSRPRNPFKYAKRFVVSDGDLYLVLNFNACKSAVRPNSYHRCRIYKLVMDDLKRPTSCTMYMVTSLGGRAFFFNLDCSFSITSRHLPPHIRPLFANRIFIAKSAFPYCRCRQDGGFRVYSARGNFIRTFRSTLALFEPPPVWIQQLNGLLDK